MNTTAEKIGISGGFRQYLGTDTNKSRLSIELDISRATLERWLRRPVELTRMDRMRKIARVTGLSEADLFEMEEPA